MKRVIPIIVSLLLLILGSVASAQDDDVFDIPEALFEEIRTIEETVEATRELPALTEVIRRFPSREEAIAFFTAAYEEELTDDVIFEESQFYRAFDFVDDDFDLEALYIELITDQVAGYYDSVTKEMNTILFSTDELGDDLPVLERFIYAHEYTHALQDQYFDLEAYLTDIEEPDEILAALSLVEGDASFVMQEYMVEYMSENPASMIQVLALSFSDLTAIPDGIPDIMIQELTMPYTAGLTFVTRLLSNGGWDAVNAAFDNPPTSTEQILHPEKYIEGEAPIPVSLAPADPQETLGDGWQLVYERTLGQFYLTEYLGTQLTSREARQAATGWGGDRYQLYYNETTNEIAWVLRILWDTDAEAEAFGGAYASFLNTRLGTSDIASTESAAGSCWQNEDTGEAACFLARDGESIIGFAPNRLLAAELIVAQNQG